MAARISTSGARALAHALEVRGDRRRRRCRVISSAIAHTIPAWRPVRPIVAAVGEEQLALAADAEAARLDRLHPARGRAGGGPPRRGRASAHRRCPSPEVARTRQGPRPHLVAAGADPGPDRRGACAPTASQPRATIPPGQPAPAAVDHRDAVGPGERDRQAVGDEDQRREAGDRRSTWPSTSPSRGPGRANASASCGPSWVAISAPWTWRPISTPCGSTPTAAAEPQAVLTDARRLVAGEQAEVERVEGRLADPAHPRREDARGHRGARPRASAARPSLRHSISRPRRLERDPQLALAPAASPSSLARRAASQAAADRRPLLDPRHEQVVAADLEPDVRATSVHVVVDPLGAQRRASSRVVPSWPCAASTPSAGPRARLGRASSRAGARSPTDDRRPATIRRRLSSAAHGAGPPASPGLRSPGQVRSSSRPRAAPSRPTSAIAARRVGLGRDPAQLGLDPLLGDRAQVGVPQQRLGLGARA